MLCYPQTRDPREVQDIGVLKVDKQHIDPKLKSKQV